MVKVPVVSPQPGWVTLLNVGVGALTTVTEYALRLKVCPKLFVTVAST